MRTLLQLSLHASVLIAATVLLRAFFLRRLPKSTFTALWLVAALRMIAPVSLPVAAPAARPVATVYRAVEQAVPAASPGGGVSWGPALWALGAALCAAGFLGSHYRCVRRYREALPVESPVIDAVVRSFGLRRTVRVRVCQTVSTPLTYGVFKPVILLPKDLDRRDREKLVCILTHELVHIRQMHIPFKYLLTLSLCLHWFNPLAWVMYALAGRDIELSCDEAVLRRMADGRTDYALTLLSLEERRTLGPLLSGFGAKAVRERIVQIMRYRPSSALSLLTAGALVLCSITVFASAAEAAPAHDEPLPTATPAVRLSEPYTTQPPLAREDTPAATVTPTPVLASPTPAPTSVPMAAPVPTVLPTPQLASPTPMPIPDRGTPPEGLPERSIDPSAGSPPPALYTPPPAEQPAFATAAP